MNTKNILLIALGVVVLGGGVYLYMSSKEAVAPTVESTVVENGRQMATTTNEEQPEGKLKVANFSGKLEEVNESCYADGECYVVVDKKHVTTVLGWRQEVVGSIKGVDSFADLKNHIGDEVEVYAKDKGDGTYTLYGSEGFYVKLK